MTNVIRSCLEIDDVKEPAQCTNDVCATMVHHVFGGEGVPCMLGSKTRTPIVVGKADSFQLRAVGDAWPTWAATEPTICALDHVHIPLAVELR